MGVGYHVKKVEMLRAKLKDKRRLRRNLYLRLYRRRATKRRQALNMKKKKKEEKALNVLEKAVVMDFADKALGPNPSAEDLRVLARIVGSEVVAPEMLGEGVTGAPPSKSLVRDLIKRARRKFAEHAEIYVDKHRDAVRAAYAAGEFDVAARHSEWAMENISEGGERLIDPPVQKQGGGAPNVLIGVKVGGMSQSGQ